MYIRSSFPPVDASKITGWQIPSVPTVKSSFNLNSCNIHVGLHLKVESIVVAFMMMKCHPMLYFAY